MAYGFTYTLPTITGSHSNYPILLKVDDFPAASIDGTVNAFANGGGDLVAYTSSAKTTQLPVEVVSFVSSGTPSAEVWVKIPTAATGNTIYLEADAVQTSQPASDSTYGSEAVWSDYAAVYHANESSGTLADATGNSHTMSATGTPNYSQTGKLGDAISFDANTSDSFSATSTSELDFSSAGYTLQSWIKQVSTVVNYGGVMTKGEDGDSDWVVLRNGTSNDLNVYHAGNIIHSGVWATLADNTFQLMHITFDNVSSKVYLDGSLESTVASTTPVTNDITRPLVLGTRGGGGATSSGSTQEEVRFRSGALSADWITMEMANHNAASGWGTVGAWEEAGTSPLVTDVNTDEIIEDGEQNNVATTTDFSGSVTGVRLKQGSFITEATGIVDTAGSVEFDVEDASGYTVDTACAPFTSTNNIVLLECYRTGEAGDIVVNRVPKSGWAIQEITGAVKTNKSLFENYVGTIADESQVLYETSDNTVVYANGEVDTDSTVDRTMQLWNKSTGEMEQLVLLIESGFQAAWAKNSNIILGIH